ncbi:MAG: hypothetical protein GY917_09550, partial [Planctomycetaceae bacterium]|nr:hypothetical protein [Planctomycetaceae bacterium]
MRMITRGIALLLSVSMGTDQGIALGQVRHPPLPVDQLPTHLDLEYVPLGLSPIRPIPADNPLTIEKVQLGRRIFFDPILSANYQVSCASSHLPNFHLASPDPLPLGIHGSQGKRHAPSLVNGAYGRSFFWDGRVKTLEEQALKPIENPLELGFQVDRAIQRLRQDQQYEALFQKAFVDGTNRTNLARALASFQRVLLAGDNPVDRFMAGDYAALTDSERQGMW